MTKYGVVLTIMDMALAKSNVNSPKKKYVFDEFELESEKKHNFFFFKIAYTLFLDQAGIFINTLKK